MMAHGGRPQGPRHLPSHIFLFFMVGFGRIRLDRPWKSVRQKFFKNSRVLQSPTKPYSPPFASFARPLLPIHAGIRLDQYGNTSKPPFAGARLLSRFNVHLQRCLANQLPAPGPAAPAIQPSTNPPAPSSPVTSHPSPFQYVKEPFHFALRIPCGAFTPAIEAHILKNLIPPEGETPTFLKKV